MNTVTAKIVVTNDDYLGIERSHDLIIKECDGFYATVHNLDECPEDAIIGRSLIDCYDLVDAIRFGMKLAKKGYDSIEVEETIVSE